jgi:hypothetical protein
LAFHQIAHAGLRGAVHPSAGIGREQVEHRVHPVVTKGFPALVAHPLQDGDIDCREVAQRERRIARRRLRLGDGYSTPNRKGYNGCPP